MAYWERGTSSVAVIMISLNEAHNMRNILENLKGWAQEVFLVDSCSSDDTLDIALEYGVHVVQRKFTGFGDQWNFALDTLPITAKWTMKIDPDERLTQELKNEISNQCERDSADGFIINRRLWFMGEILPINQDILRVWKTGKCRFSNVLVNEHPLVSGKVSKIEGILEHHDSPNLHHWIIKQNKYTTTEAISQFNLAPQSVKADLFGDKLARTMWIKKNFWKFPGRYFILYIYHLIYLGSWKVGTVGFIWARLRTDVYRYWEFKYIEHCKTRKGDLTVITNIGSPDKRVKFYD